MFVAIHSILAAVIRQPGKALGQSQMSTYLSPGEKVIKHVFFFGNLFIYFLSQAERMQHRSNKSNPDRKLPLMMSALWH